MSKPDKNLYGLIRNLSSVYLKFEIFRYLLTGLGLFVIDLLIFLGLKSIYVPTPIAQIVSRTTGAAVGFVAHKWFTFQSKDRERRTVATQGTGYLACTVINIVISPFVVSGFEYLIPGNLVVVKILSEIVIVAETYLVLRWLFRPKQQNV